MRSHGVEQILGYGHSTGAPMLLDYVMANGDDDFEGFIRRHEGHNAFIATDSRQTQAHFVASFGGRARVFQPMEPPSDPAAGQLRQTTLAAAVADLYCAAMADGPFKGCPTSSFSDTIVRLRRVLGHVHAADDHQITDAALQAQVTLHTPGGHRAHSAHGMPMTTYRLSCDC